MAFQLTDKDVQELMLEGHSQQEIAMAVQTINQEERTPMPIPNSEGRRMSAFTSNPTDNLVKWQLELNDILERAEHILREDIVFHQNGEMIWRDNPEKNKRIFNDYGVQEILRTLSLYINRNTILADYEPDEIKYKVFDFGKEINDLIFMKYEDFGLTDENKRKNYPMIVRQLIDIVHSAYTRAKYGGERTSLREARQIQQNETIMPSNINVNTGEQRRERGLLNPMRALRGKYV